MAIRDKQARFSNDENHNPVHQRSSGGSKASHRTQQRSGRRSLQDANTGASNDRDSRIRELEAALAASQSEVADLRARPLADQDSQSASGPRIRRPTNVSKVTMGQLRTSLGMGKARWNALRTAIRFALAAARLDPTENWKAQAKDRIMAARNVVKEDYPEMGRFVGDWGFDRIAQDAFSGSKSYRKCVTNPETYRGRITAARRGARRQRLRSPARSPPPRSMPASLIASPSRVGGRSTSTPLSPMPTAQHFRRAQQLPASDDDDEDDLMNFNNDPGERGQHQNSVVGDDEEHHDVIDFDEAVGIFDKGKKRAAEDATEENLGVSKRRRNK